MSASVEACDGSGLGGVTIDLVDESGTVMGTGETDGSGNFSYAGAGCPSRFIASFGGVSYGPAGFTYTGGSAAFSLMYGTGTVAVTVEDYDGGATIGSDTTTITYLGPPIAADGTGRVPLGSFRVPTDGADHWPICGVDATLYCGDSRSVIYKQASKAIWNLLPCGGCGTNADGSRAAIIPKTLHATFAGAPAALGSDDGTSVTMGWDASSWNGGTGDPSMFDTLGSLQPMRYTGSRGPNGASFNCVTRTFNPADDTYTFSSTEVPFSGAVAEFTIGPDCADYNLSYTNQIPTSPSCYQVVGMGYCPVPGSPGSFYGTYPLGFGWSTHCLIDENDGLTIGGGEVLATIPINIASSPAPACGNAGTPCPSPYDSSGDWAASATITE